MGSTTGVLSILSFLALAMSASVPEDFGPPAGGPCAANHNRCHPGAEMVYPKEIVVSDLPLEDGIPNLVMTLTEFFYDGYTASFWTRAFSVAGEVSIPGPTLRLKKGDAFSITLVNSLGPNAPDSPTEENTYRFPNTTNLHT